MQRGEESKPAHSDSSGHFSVDETQGEWGKNPLCSCECLLLDTLQVAKDMSAEKTGGFEKRGCQKRWSSADSNYFSIYEFDSVMHTTVCV